MSAVLLRNVGRFVQKLENRLTGFIELHVAVASFTSRRPCKWNYFRAHCDAFPPVEPMMKRCFGA
jgi:hypothetical protein